MDNLRKMTLAQWLDIWSKEYWNDIKESTRASYAATIKNHIILNMGATKLDALNAHTIQKFLNSLSKKQKRSFPTAVCSGASCIKSGHLPALSAIRTSSRWSRT